MWPSSAFNILSTGAGVCCSHSCDHAFTPVYDHHARLFIKRRMAQRFLEFVFRVSSISNSRRPVFYKFFYVDTKGAARIAEVTAAVFPCAGFHKLFLLAVRVAVDIQRKSGLGGLVGGIDRIHHDCHGDASVVGVQESTRVKDSLAAQ